MSATQSYTVILPPFKSNQVSSVRIVDVPVKELNQVLSGGIDMILDLVFQYGQNDFQPKNQRSVSVGDIIVTSNEFNDNEFWVVEFIGFRKLNESDFFPDNALVGESKNYRRNS